MAMTFTGSIHASQAGHEEIRTMLFGSGASLGRYSGQSPLWTGATMAVVGLVLVAVTILLGG